MKQKFQYIIVMVLSIAGLQACIDPLELPPEPSIEFIGLSADTVVVGENLTLTFSFEDGDGDIGYGPNTDRICGENICDYTSDTSCYLNPFWNAILIDLRDSCYTQFILPDVEPEGELKAVSGEIDLLSPPLSCKQFDCPTCTIDTLVYQIRVKDIAQNFSNVILSDTIIIQCN